MNLEQLVQQIRSVHEQLARHAKQAVDLSLTLRNWLIGCQIQEYELRGQDRSRYGARLYKILPARLEQCGLPNYKWRQLYCFRNFYRTYPQILWSLTTKFKRLLPSPSFLDTPTLFV